MANVRPTQTSTTRTRLLEAAARVFARAGLSGATTRAIADEAGVNEVTLFRHFQTKDRLLAAVVGQTFGSESPARHATPPATTPDLRRDLLAIAVHYEGLLVENLPLVRTMLGEIHHRHRDHERQVFHGIFRPVKAALAARIEAAQRAGEVGANQPPELLADLFAGMILTGVLRRAAPSLKLAYGADAHREAAVDLLLRGAAPAARRP
jgi:AcrR family transcriptional regulator